MIESLQNPKIKFLQKLIKKSRLRETEQLFVVEGVREIEIAQNNNYKFTQLYICKDIYNSNLNLTADDIFEVSKNVYQKIAYRSTTEGIIGIAEPKQHQLTNIQINSEKALILVAEAPEKPGNIGALLRTADAANLDAVIIANPKTDLYNSNLIRSSLGTVFSRQIALSSTLEIIEFLKNQRINIFAAALQEAKAYTNEDYTKSTAIVVGNEAEGLSKEWRDAAKQNIMIPMQGDIDSMNVSVSAAVLIFEAKRQRLLKIN